MAVKLTDYTCQAAKKGTITWDLLATGLGLRVSPKGKRVWILQLKFPGQSVQSKRRLGVYPGMSLEAARAKAAEWYSLAKAGDDPKQVEAAARAKVEAERREAKIKAEREAGNTFSAVAEAFMSGRTNRRALVDRREIERSLVKQWGSTPIHTITPRDVRTYLGSLAKRVPAEALNAWGHAVQIFKYAVHHEHIDVSPMASLDKTLTLNAKRNARKRMLSDDELVALWRATGARGYPEGHMIRWLMLSGCRLGEALGMRWQELHPELRKVLRERALAKFSQRYTDNEPGPAPAHYAYTALTDAQRVWTVPGDRTGNKSGELRLVPITDAMLDVLYTHYGVTSRSQGADDLVFSHTGEFQIGNLSKMKAWIDAHMAGTLAELAESRGDKARDNVRGFMPWVLHDLRRVVRSHLSALGVEFTVAELCIGHGKTGLQRVYDQHQYLTEMRAALTAWNNKLAGIVG